ncbi:hypothetical protein BH10ACT11_BH10ACT11_09890 [soil metagenome]
MSKAAILEREAKLRPYAAAGGFLAVVCFVLSQVIAGSIASGTVGTVPQALRQIDANSGLVEVAGVVAGIGLLSMMAPLMFLFKASQARSPRVNSGLVGLVVLGPLLYAIQFSVSAFGRVGISSDFVAQAPGVGDIYTLSSDLIDDSKLVQFASYVGGAGSIALIVIVIYTALWATRTGLLTRFTGTLGMALGASTLIASLVAIPALSVWFAYVGAVILGKGPKGRPPAWDAGEAVAPLKPGETREPAMAGGPDVIDGDATEIPGVGETNSNAARRERAKKRKRKRRR